MTVRLSVIIVNYNTKEFVLECVRSIWKSKNLDFSLKIIVVDNSSEDGSGQALAKVEGITFIQSHRNLGFSRGNNLAIGEIEGEYVWFLNPDTTVEPDTIGFMVKYMDSHRHVGVATPKLVLPGGFFDKNCHRGFPTVWNSFCHFSGLDVVFPGSRIFSGYYLGHLAENREVEVDAVGGSSLLVRRKVGETIGWWDEDYFMYGEDIEFTYRVKELGYKVMFVPQVMIHHYHGTSSGLKKSSLAVTRADMQTKSRSMLATTGAMRIFYGKHYAQRYPGIVNRLVYWGIAILEKWRSISLKYANS